MREPTELTEVSLSPAADADLDAREYLYVILHRRWLIALVTIGVMALAAVASYVQTPQYEATALIQIEPRKVELVGKVEGRDGIGNDEFYATQLGILRSRSLAERVMDELQLWGHALFRPGGDVRGGESAQHRLIQLESLLEKLSVDRIESTQLVEIRFTTADPELSAQLSNSLARQYIAYNAEALSGIARSTSAFLQEQISKIRQNIVEKETLLRKSSQEDDIVMPDEQESITVQRLKELNAELTRVQGERASAEALHRNLEGQDVSSLPEITESAAIQSLKEQHSQLLERYAELSAKFKPSYPELQRTKGAIEDVERRLQQETNDIASKARAAAQARYETLRDRENILRRELGRLEQETRDLNTVTADYLHVQVELDNDRTLLEELLRRQSETGLDAELGERHPQLTVRLVDEAVASAVRVSPNHVLNVSLGAMFGLLLSVGLTVLFYFWDTTIRNIEDVRRFLRLPVVGVIPHADSSAVRWTGRAGAELVPTRPALNGVAAGRNGKVREKPPSNTTTVLERFKFLRSSLTPGDSGPAPRIILVTSSVQGEGKTFVSWNLAASLADLGKRVLLVESDLRRPGLQDVFGVSGTTGLTTLLKGQPNGATERPITKIRAAVAERDPFRAAAARVAPGLHDRYELATEESETYLAKEIQDCVLATPFPGLYLIPSGPTTPSPAELLGSSVMDSVLQHFVEEFDHVVLDSAPLLPVVDTHLLLRRSNTTLLVVRSGFTNRQAVKNSKELVERANGRIAGIVINDVDFSDRAHREYYGYGSYGYGRDAEGGAGEEAG